jgi:hypothetical protein
MLKQDGGVSEGGHGIDPGTSEHCDGHGGEKRDERCGDAVCIQKQSGR